MNKQQKRLAYLVYRAQMRTHALEARFHKSKNTVTNDWLAEKYIGFAKSWRDMSLEFK